MKTNKTALFAALVVICLIGAAVSSYLFGTVHEAWAVCFGFVALLFGVAFSEFAAKLIKD